MPPRAGIRVLVTDDHPANRELVQLFLAAVGAEITEAEDGEAAVEAAARQAFDVILMDLRMPRLDGIGAVARIRAAAGPNQATPILAFTADATSAFDDRLEALGFDGVVAKPVEPGQLIAAIFGAVAAADRAVALGVGLQLAEVCEAAPSTRRRVCATWAPLPPHARVSPAAPSGGRGRPSLLWGSCHQAP